ncbi:MAG: nucleotidyltransferase family protein [Gammaproteobacteria bacterium]|nr:nucleotidyltransferase family protein [Gammaproteobacteria bacterium]
MKALRLGAVLLAAGLGSRFSAGNKLLHPYRGRPVLAWALDTLTLVPLVDRVVVIGVDDPAKRALVENHPVRIVENPRPADGMGHSLALGIQMLAADLDAAFVCLGDMPDLSVSVFEILAINFARHTKEAIVIPCYAGERGHPVLFGRAHFTTLTRLDGDQGARKVVAGATEVITVAFDDPRILRDIDTVADLTPT